MVHEILAVGPLQCNCSVVGDPATREAMVIDPGDDIGQIMAVVRRHGLLVKQIVVTHAHIDHVGGAMQLKRLTGAAILMNGNDYPLLQMLDTQAAWLGMKPPGAVEIDAGLGDAARVAAGKVEGRVIHTPGHTQGSVCLLFEAGNTLIAGDTLFAGGIGRTDLTGGSFRQIMASLRERILQLPDDTVVVPGHGGLTTVGQERATNPFLIGD